ncbi:MAG: hypothetical protein R6V20_08600 [Desulfobia sp.]
MVGQGYSKEKYYTNLDQLISAICRDALIEFQDFYLADQVTVKPFQLISGYDVPKTTLLGVTLADQMAADLSGNSTLSWFHRMTAGFNGIIRPGERYEPKIEGLIEELDGYLRVHITACNSFGEKRDFVVSAEMSEPLYQAFHTRVKVYESY